MRPEKGAPLRVLLADKHLLSGPFSEGEPVEGPMKTGGLCLDPDRAPSGAGRRAPVVLGLAMLLLVSVFAGCLGSDADDPSPTGAGDGPVDASGDGGDSGTQPSASDGDGDGTGDGSGDGSAGGADNGTKDENGNGDDGSDGGGDGGGNGSDGGGSNGSDGGNETGDGEGNETGDGGSGGGSGGSGGGSSSTPSDPWAQDDPPWPELSQATVRPGVSVKVGASYCTSNFLFRSLDNGTLYLGLAAHCVQNAPSSFRAEVYNIDGGHEFNGEVVYSSWSAIGFNPEDPAAGDDVHPHDFALIELPRDERSKVHPALMHYGGPVAMAQWEEVSTGDWLLAYGNSPSRPGDTFSAQEGYLVDTLESTHAGETGYSVLAHMAAPPIPGDSGSGLMTAQGEALGVLSSITVGTPYGVWWEYASLPHALAYVNDHNEWDLALATWDELDSGLLP